MQGLDEARNTNLPDGKLESGSRGELIKLASRLRDRRNELNQMTSERVSKRNDLNAKTREKIGEAQRHREKHDEMNLQVQERKRNRNRLNAKANEFFDEVDEVKSNLEFDDDKDINKLEKEIEQLEFRQRAEVLSTEDERELIKKIGNKREEFRQRKDKVEESGDLEKLIGEAEEVRPEASQHHQKVTELADDVQEHRNQMIEAYREASGIRDKTDEIYKLFVGAQEAADRHHEDFAHVQKRLRGLNKKEERQYKDSRAEEREAVKVEAKKIYQEFEEGETLETRDLMKLQKSGLL